MTLRRRRTREQIELDAIERSLDRYERLLRWHARALELRRSERSDAVQAPCSMSRGHAGPHISPGPEAKR